jgi:hypothetical protein
MTLSLDSLSLSKGSHTSRDDGLCVMEAVAWLADEQHSDRPQCASPVITAFAMGLNDTWDDEARQRLIPYTKLIVNTRDGLDDQRALMAFDWLCRVHVPAWLDLAGFAEEAASLRNGPTFSDWSMLAEMTVRLQRASEKTRAAGDAAGDAAWAAARAAAWAAARDAAWAATGAAAWAAAWAAAGAAAWAAAWAATRDAARDAAWDAAWDAARDAAWDALQPTVRELQDSALDLLDRMCRLGAES